MENHHTSNEELTFWQWDGRILICTIIILMVFGWVLLKAAQAEVMQKQQEQLQIQQSVP